VGVGDIVFLFVCLFGCFFFAFVVVVYLSICFHFNRKLPFENYSKTLCSATLFCRR